MNTITECPECGCKPSRGWLQPHGLTARIAELEAALREIAARGPVAGHASADALRLRLVGSQSIARAALKVAP